MVTQLDLALDGCLSPASFTRPGRIVPPYAWIEHIPFAFWLVDAIQPRQVVELGTHTGNSFFAFCQAASGLPIHLSAVDTWQGDEHAGLYDETVYNAVRRYRDATFPDSTTLLRMTFAEARAKFAPGSIDVLHIDGLHTYEAVREDFTTWREAVSPRGVVLFHDIAVRDRGFGVWRLWDELTAQYPSFSFEHCNGLGVLAVGADVPEPVRRLCQLPEARAETLRLLYQRLGGSLLEWQSEHNRLLHELDGIYQSRSWKLASAIAGVANVVRGRRAR